MKQTDAPAAPVEPVHPLAPLTVDVKVARTVFPDPDDSRTTEHVIAAITGATMSPATAARTLRGLADEIDPPQPVHRLPGHYGPGIRRSGDVDDQGVVRVDDGTTGGPVVRQR